jgi:hypothetical protein
MAVSVRDHRTTIVVDFFKQWKFNAGSTQPLVPKPSFNGPASRNLNLKNSRVRKLLQGEHQTFGINLGWTDDAEPATVKKVTRWFLARQGTSTAPVKYGELLALGYGGDPSFIKYEKRTVGINLGWSNTPRFEWKLLGGHKGQPVHAGEWLAIYNQKAGECLIYFDRTVGGDIGWPSSQTWTDQLGDILTEAIKEYGDDAVAYLLAA